MRNPRVKGNTDQALKYSKTLLKAQRKSCLANLTKAIRDAAAETLLTGNINVSVGGVKVEITESLPQSAKSHFSAYQNTVVMQSVLAQMLDLIEVSALRYVLIKLYAVSKDNCEDLQKVYTQATRELCDRYPALFKVYNGLKFGYSDNDGWSSKLIELLKNSSIVALRSAFYAEFGTLVGINDQQGTTLLSHLIGTCDADPKHLIHAALHHRLTATLRRQAQQSVKSVARTPQRMTMVSKIYADIGYDVNKNQYRQGSHTALLIYGVCLPRCSSDTDVQHLIDVVAQLRGR